MKEGGLSHHPNSSGDGISARGAIRKGGLSGGGSKGEGGKEVTKYSFPKKKKEKVPYPPSPA